MTYACALPFLLREEKASSSLREDDSETTFQVHQLSFVISGAA